MVGIQRNIEYANFICDNYPEGFDSYPEGGEVVDFFCTQLEKIECTHRQLKKMEQMRRVGDEKRIDKLFHDLGKAQFAVFLLEKAGLLRSNEKLEKAFGVRFLSILADIKDFDAVKFGEFFISIGRL